MDVGEGGVCLLAPAFLYILHFMAYHLRLCETMAGLYAGNYIYNATHSLCLDVAILSAEDQVCLAWVSKHLPAVSDWSGVSDRTLQNW